MVQEKDRGESIPSRYLSEGEVRTSFSLHLSLILSKSLREIGDMHSACDGWMSSTWDMLSFSKALRCWRSLGSEWRSGQRLGRSAIRTRLGTCSLHLSTQRAVRTRWYTFPILLTRTWNLVAKANGAQGTKVSHTEIPNHPPVELLHMTGVGTHNSSPFHSHNA